MDRRLIAAAWLTAWALLAPGCGGDSEPPAQGPWAAPHAPVGAAIAGGVMQPARRRALAATAGDAAAEATALLNWAEIAYPQLFPGPQPDQSYPPYVYRQYPSTGHLLGVANGQVYVLGPVTGGQIVSVGRVADFACNIAPRACQPLPGELPVRQVALSAATAGTLGAAADGRVLAWGLPALEGSLSLPYQRAQIAAGLHSVVAVHAHAAMPFAIQADGTLLAWGQDGYRKTQGGAYPYRSVALARPTPIPGLPKVADAAVCEGTVLWALGRDGRVWYAPGPQRGGAAPPAAIDGLTDVVALGHGRGDCRPMFIRADGSVYTADFNDAQGARGQVPVTLGRVDGLADVASIDSNGVAVTRSGAVQVLDSLAPRNDGSANWVATPRAIAGLPKARRAVAWRNKTADELAVLTEDGAVWAVPLRGSPVLAFDAAEGFVEIDALDGHVTGRKSDGSVWSWGDNGLGQHGVGAGAITVRRGRAVQASFVNLDACSADVRACAKTALTLPIADRPLSLGLYGYGLALAADGSLLAWGDAQSFLDASVLQPVAGSIVMRVSGLPPLAAVVGWGQLLIAQNGDLWAWGPHTGEFDGVRTLSLKRLKTPSRVPFYQDVVDAHLGCGRVLALRRDGTLWRTPDFDGVLESEPRSPVPVIGFDGVVAIGSGNPDGDRGCEAHVVRADGSVWVVRQDSDTVDLIPGLPPTAQVSCTYLGTEACLARTRSGEVWGWGNNADGTLGDGTRERRVQPVHGPRLGAVQQLAAADGARVIVGGGMLGWGRVRTATWSGVQLDTRSVEPLSLAPQEAALAAMSDDARAVVQRDGTLWLWGLTADGKNCGGVVPDCRVYRRVSGVAARTRP